MSTDLSMRPRQASHRRSSPSFASHLATASAPTSRRRPKATFQSRGRFIAIRAGGLPGPEFSYQLRQV